MGAPSFGHDGERASLHAETLPALSTVRHSVVDFARQASVRWWLCCIDDRQRKPPSSWPVGSGHGSHQGQLVFVEDAPSMGDRRGTASGAVSTVKVVWRPRARRAGVVDGARATNTPRPEGRRCNSWVRPPTVTSCPVGEGGFVVDLHWWFAW
jgi:hypothetical protein